MFCLISSSRGFKLSRARLLSPTAIKTLRLYSSYGSDKSSFSGGGRRDYRSDVNREGRSGGGGYSGGRGTARSGRYSGDFSHGGSGQRAGYDNGNGAGGGSRGRGERYNEDYYPQTTERDSGYGRGGGGDGRGGYRENDRSVDYDGRDRESGFGRRGGRSGYYEGRGGVGGGYGRDGGRGSYGRGRSSGPERGGGGEMSYPDRRSPEFQFGEDKLSPIHEHYSGDHIFGMGPVIAAFRGNRRQLTELLVQEGMDPSNKKDEASAQLILDSAKERGLPTREFSKHDLNLLTENRPHQGFVLRAEQRETVEISGLEPETSFQCVLALDEVTDPMNLGALLRTAHFLGVSKVVLCSKNSAPLSPVVSKASAGALELMDVYSTKNMMRFLDKSRENSWQVVGTALSEGSIDVKELSLEKPTILVLGNEGHGIRTNILKRCDKLVRISGKISQGDTSTVDSLNVSVSGGILMNYIMSFA